MKIIVFIICFFTASFLYAEKSKEVLLRFNQQDNSFRIVLESDEDFIKKANSITSRSTIKIEFPAEFGLKQQNDFMFETSVKDRFLVIDLKNVTDIRSYKLSSPARLVIDIKTAAKSQPDPLSQAAKTPQQESEQPPEKTRTVRIVVIDPGHGGYEYGVVSGDAREKDINLTLSKDLNNMLSKKGIKAYLTRKADQSLSINDRIDFINKYRPDVFISIHSSSSDRFVIYTSATDDQSIDVAFKLYSLSLRQSRHIEKSRELSKRIGESIKSEFNVDVIAREMPLPVLKSSDAPAVLIEYPSPEFLSHDQKIRDRFISSILKGLSAYEQ
ncbi:MAG: N-acetylmuramoyl-L-alanine amidase [Nitrospirota bacterium]